MSKVLQPRQIQCRCDLGKGRRFLEEVLTKCLAAFILAIIGIETSVITFERCCWASRAFSLRIFLALDRALLPTHNHNSLKGIQNIQSNNINIPISIDYMEYSF